MGGSRAAGRGASPPPSQRRMARLSFRCRRCRCSCCASSLARSSVVPASSDNRTAWQREGWTQRISDMTTEWAEKGRMRRPDDQTKAKRRLTRLAPCDCCCCRCCRSSCHRTAQPAASPVLHSLHSRSNCRTSKRTSRTADTTAQPITAARAQPNSDPHLSAASAAMSSQYRVDYASTSPRTECANCKQVIRSGELRFMCYNTYRSSPQRCTAVHRLAASEGARTGRINLRSCFPVALLSFHADMLIV